MATDLKTRKASLKSDDVLRRKFAEVCARIQRVDLVAHLLVLLLTTVIYALLVAVFDWFVGTSTAAFVDTTRWIAYVAFLLLFFLLAAKSVHCFFRRVNPYYVAHQLEETLPDAKNSLINWLDLNEEELPSAFQKNLGARAAEQWDDVDADTIVARRKNWILLGMLAAPLVGLAVLFVLDPGALLASLRRAFVPFYAPAPISRTLLTLVHPEGDIEVISTQSVTFAARIEGRVPAVNQPDAPRLQWRYQDNEDYFTLPLQRDDAGLWTATLHASQLRTGLTYKVTAADVETPEHQVRVRARAHVNQFDIAYRHRAFRKLANTKATFPNEQSATPHIFGPLGSEVEMIVRTSRPIKSARVEFVAAKIKQDLPVELLKVKVPSFVCRFTLERTGQFRVIYTADDGEENADREWYPIDVLLDDLPKVVLTRPGKDMEMPYNASFVLEGKATSGFGVRGLKLAMRVIDGTQKGLAFSPIVYRPDKSFQLDDGTFPLDIDYMEFAALNQLKDAQGASSALQAGGILEYWLEATDGTDYPSATGNVGKSNAYKIKLLDVPVDPKQEEIKRKAAAKQQSQHQKKQDDQQKKNNQKSKEKKDGGTGGAGGNPQAGLDQMQKQNDETKDKINDALNQSQPDRGGAKGSNPESSGSKGGEGSRGGPQPMDKPQSMMPDQGGDRKDQGGAGAETRGQGTPMPKQGANDPPPQGNAKPAEHNGPERPTPEQQKAKNAAPPPDVQAKSGGMNDAGGPKSDPKEAPGDPTKGAGQARGEEPKTDAREPSLERIAKNLQKLPGDGPEGDAAAKDLADIAKEANDPAKRELAQAILQKNGRDAKTGKKMKNPFGSGGKSPGISDEIKTAAANREFAARIGQMQLADWQKRLTPDLLKKANVSPEEWDRFVKNTRDYDAQVRALNAQIARQALKQMVGPRTAPGSSLNIVENTGASNESPSATIPPPELRDALRRFSQPPEPAKK